MRSYGQDFGDEVAGLIDAHRAEISRAFCPYATARLQAARADSHDLSTVERHGTTRYHGSERGDVCSLP
jgi:hypothetical protein